MQIVFCICAVSLGAAAGQIEDDNEITHWMEGEQDGELLIRDLSDVQREMDAPLCITSDNAETAGKDDRATVEDSVEMPKLLASSGSGEQGVTLGKSAKWTDIEHGFAQIDLTESDTDGASNQGVDYIIILDRTRTMSLSDKTFSGGESDKINLSNSPCINTDHYYEYDGRQLTLYDYQHGVIRGTSQAAELPEDEGIFYSHYNSSGERIGIDYSSGCVDRLTIAKNTINGLIDKIAANSPSKAAPNRVSYWSFAGIYWPEQEGELDTDHEKGIYNYIGLTNDFSAVKQKVSATKTYAGTYYQQSFQRAYEQLSARTGDYKDRPAKVIFISDGKCSDDLDEVQSWNNKLRQIKNCKIYTLAVGMPVSSEGAQLLKDLSTNRDSSTFASFTTNLNSSNPAFANTLAQIENDKITVSVTKKVVTDKLETQYWEYVSILAADGSASCKDGVVTWNVPDGSGKTYKCSIKVKLKDTYRYMVSDTKYPTNHDTPEQKGCHMDYEIKGGPDDRKKQSKEVPTPELPYGTISISGTKKWTVTGSEADSIALTLSRKENGSSIVVNSAEVSAKDGWRYTFERRIKDAEELPLILYNNGGTKLAYSLTEEAEGYTLLREETKETSGTLEKNLVNEPWKIKVRIKKQDAENGTLLDGAKFGVYEYNKETQTYESYKGNDSSVTGTIMMELKGIGKGEYETPFWLYYTTKNEGKFCVVEECAPKGYRGDYANGTSGEKNRYEIEITKDNTGKTITSGSDGKELIVKNERTKGSIMIVKKDKDTRQKTGPGGLALYGEDEETNAKYGLYTTDHKLVAEKRISKDGTAIFENLELGDYYVKELEDAPKGYLVSGDETMIALAWDNEAQDPMVTTDVFEPVKKQSLRIYKVEGDEGDTELTWLDGAGFSVFSLKDIVPEKILTGASDEDILEWVMKTYRDKKTLRYDAMKELPTVTLYDEWNHEAFCLSELKGEGGIVETPGLPYGDYCIVETTVPRGKRPALPIILHVTEDKDDGIVEGDGKGTKLKDRIIYDKDVKAKIRIVKEDACLDDTVKQGTAAYMIHDTDGAYGKMFLKTAPLLQRAEYLLKYNGLVVEYDEKTAAWIGTKENPYLTEVFDGEFVKGLMCLTTAELPEGLYELEELKAPDGYVLSGYEGVIDKDPLNTAYNGTYYEKKEKGKWKSKPQSTEVFLVSEETGEYDEATGCWWVTVVQKNTPVIGKISVHIDYEKEIKNALGELTGITKKENLNGALFELKAKTTITSPTGRVLFEAGDKVMELRTGEDGTVWTGQEDGPDGEALGLPLGVYELTLKDFGPELKGENMMINGGMSRTVRLTYIDEKNPVVYADEEFHLRNVNAKIKTPEPEQDPPAPEPAAGDPVPEPSVYVNPKTGDVQKPVIWLLLSLTALAALAGAGYKLKRRK